MTSAARFLRSGIAPLFSVVTILSSAAVAQAPAANSSRPAVPKAAPSATSRAIAPVSGQKPQGASAGDQVVAHVGSSDVTADQVRAFVAAMAPREQAAILRDPALLTQAVRAMIANQMILKEALDKKWEQQPAIAAQLERLRENAITEAYLQTVSAAPTGFPADADVEKAYEANKLAFLMPRQFQISQVYVALPSDADKAKEDAARKKLTEVQAKLKQPGADFAAIATSNSDDHETASRGGEIGWVAESQVRPEIKAQIQGMAKGAISDAVKTDDGWHFVKLIDTKAAYTRSLAEVHDFLVERLRAQRAEANRRAYVAKLLEQSPPAINEIALSKIFSDAGETAGR